MIRFAILSAIALAAAAWAAAPALAQTTFEAPRFEGLEMQNQRLEQGRLDSLEAQRQAEAFKPIQPNSGVSFAESALRQQQIEDEARRLRLEGDQMRDRQAREVFIREQTLPNRRIAATSVLVVPDPYRYNLPPAPEGQFYARLEGRFVLVDRTSELVVKVLEPKIGDPVGDLPPNVAPKPERPIPIDRLREPGTPPAPTSPRNPR